MNLKQIVVFVLVALIAVGGCKKKNEEQPAPTPPPPAAEPAAEQPAAPAETPPAETPPAETPPATPPVAEQPATPPAEGGGCQAFIDKMIACSKEMAGPAWTPEAEAAAKQGGESTCTGWNATPQGAKILEAVQKCMDKPCMEFMTCYGTEAAAAMGVAIPAVPAVPPVTP